MGTPQTPQPRRLRTWSAFEGVRRKPNEYEVTAGRFHYHFGRQPAPFDLDPDAPLNAWYRRYREGSRLRSDSWEGFRDPEQLNYRRYIALQHERELYAESVVDDFEARDQDAGLDAAWVALLGRLHLPSRFALHVQQLSAMYLGQLGPSAYVSNAAFFQAADELRAIQWVAYRAKALSLSHGDELADSQRTRRIWEDDPVWQPAREALEKLLIAYDWGETLVALDLVIKPLLDGLLRDGLAELAHANGDELTALLLRETGRDSDRSRTWSQALALYAIGERAANREVIDDWVQKWLPRATAAVQALAAPFAEAPVAGDPEAATSAATATVQARLEQLLADAAAA